MSATSFPTLVHLVNGHLAISTTADNGETVRLAVPPLHPRLPRSVRRQVFELVLRRQLGLAETVAQIEADVIEGRDRFDSRYAAMLAETPHRGATGNDGMDVAA